MSRIDVNKIFAVNKILIDCAKAQLKQLIQKNRSKLLISLLSRLMIIFSHVSETFKIQEDFKIWTLSFHSWDYYWHKFQEREKKNAAQKMRVFVKQMYLLDSRPIVYTRCSNPNNVPFLSSSARHFAITYVLLENSNSSNDLQTFAGTLYELKSGEDLKVVNNVDQSFSSNCEAFSIKFSWSRKL